MVTIDVIGMLAAKRFGIDPQAIDPDAPIQALGADSLGFMEFLFELEEHFGITINQELAAGVHTVRELGALIDRINRANFPHAS